MPEKITINDSEIIKKTFRWKFSKPTKNSYPTNKTSDYHFDEIWSLKILDLKGYGPEKNSKYKFVLVVFDNFSKLDWTVPIRNKKRSNKKRPFLKYYSKLKKKTNFDRDRRWIGIFKQNF